MYVEFKRSLAAHSTVSKNIRSSNKHFQEFQLCNQNKIVQGYDPRINRKKEQISCFKDLQPTTNTFTRVERLGL